MQVEFTTSKNLGAGFATLIRQNLIESATSVKAVAYKFSDGSNLYRPAEDGVDMTAFMVRLCDLNIRVAENVELPLVIRKTIRGKLTSKDLCGQEIAIDEDVVLYESLAPEKPVVLSLVLDSGSGYQSSEVIRKTLEKKGCNLTDFHTVSARHSNVRVTTKVTPDLDREQVVLNITSDDKAEEAKAKEVLLSIINKFQEIYDKL